MTTVSYTLSILISDVTKMSFETTTKIKFAVQSAEETFCVRKKFAEMIEEAKHIRE